MVLNPDKLWYEKHPLRWVLWPFSLIYQLVACLRCLWLKLFRQQQFAVPIIVVGNLTVGGVGKTPLVIALAQALSAKGLRVGIVSRGYGAGIKTFPYAVTSKDPSTLVGDEPSLIVKKTDCPLVIAPKRVEAVQYLLKNFQSQVIISDDGLQHHAMGRAIEIVVLDGVRGLGNGLCLPAGPLRESSRRLSTVDFLVVNGGEWPNAYKMTLNPGVLTQVGSTNTISPEQLIMPVAAVAGIGHPERFFTTLKNLSIHFKPYAFADHHAFIKTDLQFAEKNVVMTEKDAVKCQAFADPSWYFLPVEAQLSASFWQALWSHEQLKGYC